MNWRTSAAVIAVILQPTICFAQAAIGNASSVRNEVEGILGGQSSPITSGSSVRANELIRSGDGAVANLVFLDQTKLAVGPRSEVRLDKFIYNPDQRNGAVVIQLTKGAYRFVTGVQDSRSYEIKTPVATMGVRGTILEISLESYRGNGPSAGGACQSNVKVRLVEGAFQARTISGKFVSITEPGKLLTVCSDGTFQVTPNSQSILNFQPEFATLPSPNVTIGTLAIAGSVIGTVAITRHKNPQPLSP